MWGQASYQGICDWSVCLVPCCPVSLHAAASPKYILLSLSFRTSFKLGLSGFISHRVTPYNTPAYYNPTCVSKTLFDLSDFVSSSIKGVIIVPVSGDCHKDSDGKVDKTFSTVWHTASIQYSWSVLCLFAHIVPFIWNTLPPESTPVFLLQLSSYSDNSPELVLCLGEAPALPQHYPTHHITNGESHEGWF